jgi:hypothetical protein
VRAPADAIETYIRAKDGSRPFLMRQAFAENAELEMVVKTDAISFPSSAKGVAALSDILVSRFGLDYENVYTFCLTGPPATPCRHFACHWLVGMSAKAGGAIRVGCGRYDWHFAADGRVQRLVIAIDVMKLLGPQKLSATMTWLSALPYPWCRAEEAMTRMPASKGLAEIKAYLGQVRPLAPAA